MTAAIHDFRSIRRKLERQEQKAEFEEKNPKVEPSMYGWPYGVACPMTEIRRDIDYDAPLYGFSEIGVAACVVTDANDASHSLDTSGTSSGTEHGVQASGHDLAELRIELESWEAQRRAKIALKSMAHPEWPYAGTGFEWTKFVKVKI